MVATDELRRRIADSTTQQRGSLGQTLRAWLLRHLVEMPLTAGMQPTALRLRLMGATILVGHPLFFLMWAYVFPQPHEDLGLRLAVASLGALFFTRHVQDPKSRRATLLIHAVHWFNLPLIFSWMYMHNAGNAVWLASLSAIIVLYYWLTDWRMATIGLLAAALIVLGSFELLTGISDVFPPHREGRNVAVLGFFVAVGMIVGISVTNLQPKQLENTLATMGIVAHELRTPLATITLLADALRENANSLPPEQREAFGATAQTLESLVRTMNHQIETHITNARLNRLPATKETVQAGDVVQGCVDNYPFRGERERSCVTVAVRQDFAFLGSSRQFGQVLDNLVKNALHAIAATGKALQPGGLLLVVDVQDDHGVIYVSDCGIGIHPSIRPNVFTPFFSTDLRTCHGLGLPFCKQVVETAGGSIDVVSKAGEGATFMIRLPLAPGAAQRATIATAPRSTELSTSLAS